jgi:GntR family histidine utilization transcriptional repressor
MTPYQVDKMDWNTELKSLRSPRPLYQQVKRFIEDQIQNGNLAPNTKIPSENKLVEKLGVSRMTIHRALRELTADGHLIRLQGVGTFVAQRKPKTALLEIKSIADEIKDTGGRHSSTVHLLQEETLSPDLAVAMELPEGSPVFHSILVHRHNGQPIQLADRYVNPLVAPDYLSQDFTRTTPSDYLLSIAPIAEVEHIVEAVAPDRHTQHLLDIGPSEPCLLMVRKTWTHREVATWNRFIYPGSRYRIGGRFKPTSSIRPLTA